VRGQLARSMLTYRIQRLEPAIAKAKRYLLRAACGPSGFGRTARLLRSAALIARAVRMPCVQPTPADRLRLQSLHHRYNRFIIATIATIASSSLQSLQSLHHRYNCYNRCNRYNRFIIGTIATIAAIAQIATIAFENPPQQVRLGWGDAAVGKRIQRGGGARTLWLRIVATSYAARQTRDTPVTLLDCVATWKRSGGQALGADRCLQTCPLSSQVNADMQIHINGDVMMAIKQYLYATGDLLWLEHEGAPHPPRASVCTRSLTHRLTRPPSSLPYSVPPVLSLPLPPAFCSFLMAASRAASLLQIETAR
jgi:hypothetical protein